MILVFGRNRRQRPIELRCPGGVIRVARAAKGTVEIEITAEAGRIEYHAERGSASGGIWAATVRLVNEEG